MNAQHEFVSEYVINNLPFNQRKLLSSEKILRGISKLTGVNITVRGRYIKPNSDGSLVCNRDERPLRLSFKGRSKHNMKFAAEKVRELLKIPVKISPSTKNNDTDADDNDSLEEKITCGIDTFPLNFNIKSKILGTNHENIKFIQKITNATISLHGKGSGSEIDNGSDESLYLHVRYNSPGKKKKTRELIFNLIETIHTDFVEHCGKYPSPKKPKIIAVRNQKCFVTSPAEKSIPEVEVPESEAENNIEKITIGLSQVPPEFNLKTRIYGRDLVTVKLIEKVCGAHILFKEENKSTSEPPCLLVMYRKPDRKDEARELIYCLLDTIHKAYVKECGIHVPKPSRPQIVLCNKNVVKEEAMKANFLPKTSPQEELRRKILHPPLTSEIHEPTDLGEINFKFLNDNFISPPTVRDSVTVPINSIICRSVRETANSSIISQSEPQYPDVYGTSICSNVSNPFLVPLLNEFPKFQYIKKRSLTHDPSNMEISKNVCNWRSPNDDPYPKKKPKLNEENITNYCPIPTQELVTTTSIPDFVDEKLVQIPQKGRINASAVTTEKSVHDIRNGPSKTSIKNANNTHFGPPQYNDVESDDESNKSVILFDLEYELCAPKKPTPVVSKKKATEKHITKVSNDNECGKIIECQCGRFKSVRSVAVQTETIPGH